MENKTIKKFIAIIIALMVVVSASLLVYNLTNNTTNNITEDKITGKLVAEDKIIKIGIMTPLTGDAAVWGQEVKKGVEIAQDDISVNSDYEIDFIFEDTKCNGKDGVSALNKLVNYDGVKLTAGTVCSSVALSAAPVLDQNKVIHISAGASNPEISNAGDYMFRIWPSDSFEGTELSNYAIKELNVKKVGILYLNNDYGAGLKDAFKENFVAKVGNVAVIQSYESSSKDFKTQLTKIKSKNVDAVYFVANPGETSLILKQIQELNIDAIILANGPAIEGKEVLETAGDSAENVYYAQSNQKTAKLFKQKYRRKFNSEAGFASDLGYDVAMLLYKGIDECNSDDVECVQNYLSLVKDYEGASTTLTFDENGDVIVPFVIKQVQNNEPVVLN